jgi:hypothetical protein
LPILSPFGVYQTVGDGTLQENKTKRQMHP